MAERWTAGCNSSSRRRMHVTCSLPESDAAMEVDADRVRLQQVLTNLLGNAVRHALPLPGGGVRVAVSFPYRTERSGATRPAQK